MVSCWDCEYFGTKCQGVVPPIEYRDKIDQYCAKFKVISWRGQMYKPEGRARM